MPYQAKSGLVEPTRALLGPNFGLEPMLESGCHLSRRNTITQAQRNIASHYDMEENEDLKVAQMRKISLLIAKARITNNHEVLEIGCGWGSLALEIVKQIGCRYTGITLSEEQLKYAQEKDHIKLLLCDYRQLPKFQNGMLEAVGHEYMEEFFGCCESLLTEDGIFFISIPDQRYNAHRRSSDFMNVYIFPGGLLPSLSRVTSAMTTASRLWYDYLYMSILFSIIYFFLYIGETSIEHVENIGIHYLQTLICWRRNFLANKRLGFDEKFIHTWEYYFVYCAAGFKSHTLGDYQVKNFPLFTMHPLIKVTGAIRSIMMDI
ncbi:Tuberculostearic acid methyltransferase [Nymphaea thermarum]|nr:Tuberculostearic acid methyltransferase [Nymphaea thermarum]